MFENTANLKYFESAISASDIEMGLDNVNLNDDDIHEVASDAWKKLINSENKEDILSFVQFMELVKTYNTCLNSQCFKTVLENTPVACGKLA